MWDALPMRSTSRNILQFCSMLGRSVTVCVVICENNIFWEWFAFSWCWWCTRILRDVNEGNHFAFREKEVGTLAFADDFKHSPVHQMWGYILCWMSNNAFLHKLSVSQITLPIKGNVSLRWFFLITTFVSFRKFAVVRNN